MVWLTQRSLGCRAGMQSQDAELGCRAKQSQAEPSGYKGARDL